MDWGESLQRRMTTQQCKWHKESLRCLLLGLRAAETIVGAEARTQPALPRPRLVLLASEIYAFLTPVVDVNVEKSK
jgi:hypothetical protein